MFLFFLLMIFLLTCVAGWLLLFPASRHAVLESMATLGRSSGERWRCVQQRGGARSAGWGRAARFGWQSAAAWLRRHLLLTGAAAALLIVPVLLALMLSGRTMLGGYDGADSYAVNSQVLDLLKGEQLTAPAPLPPLFFTTAEVLQVRPMLDSANRNWLLLDADFAQRLLLVFKIMREQHGYDMAILEGYRSPERQDMLAAAGPSVSNARAFQSYHQFGLAADCAFLRDGKLLISEKDPWALQGYRLYGEVAESVGLNWGGRWTMMDFGHTELRRPGAIKKTAAK